MPAANKTDQARRPRYAPLCIILGVAAWLWASASGCLNPRPDENPSSNFSDRGAERATAPAADTGEENPLLAGGAPADPGPAPPANIEINYLPADAGASDAGVQVDGGGGLEP